MAGRVTYINLSMKSTLKGLGGDIRILQPYGLLAERPDVLTRVQYDRISLSVPDMATEQVYVRYRPVGNRSTWPLQRGALQLGFLVVVDMDDLPFHDGYRESDYVAFRGAHAVQTSTPALAELIRGMNPEVRVFPNTIRDIPPPRPPLRPPLGPSRPTPGDGPVRLFFGALNRQAAWQPLLPALNRVLAAHPETRIDVVWDRALFDRLETRHKRLHPVQPYADYLRLMDTADICLLPLAGHGIDLYKSDLKFLEAASRGAVCLASPSVYAATLRHDETGLLFRSPEAFEHELTRLVRDRGLRARLAAAAHRYVSAERRMEDQVDARLDWYRDLLDRKPALDRGIRERAPWIVTPDGQPPSSAAT